jgi:hypothetical protein
LGRVLIDDRSPPPSNGDRPAIDPNWRVVGWFAAAGVLGFAGAHAAGFVAFLILCATVYAVCRGFLELIPYGDGLREWRQ